MATDKWNVPGSVEYRNTRPIDTVLRANRDARLRGYWLARDDEGQVCLVSNQSAADDLTLDIDEDGFPVIRYSDETEEFGYDGFNTIRIKRYS